MSDSHDPLDVIADALGAIEAMDLAVTRLALYEIDAGQVFVTINATRALVDAVVDQLDEVVGAGSNGLVESLLNQAAALLELGNVVLSQNRSPREIEIPLEASARQIVFDQFGSLELLAEFVGLNSGVVSTNFYPAGATVRLPRA